MSCPAQVHVSSVGCRQPVADRRACSLDKLLMLRSLSFCKSIRTHSHMPAATCAKFHVQARPTSHAHAGGRGSVQCVVRRREGGGGSHAQLPGPEVPAALAGHVCGPGTGPPAKPLPLPPGLCVSLADCLQSDAVQCRMHVVTAVGWCARVARHFIRCLPPMCMMYHPTALDVMRGCSRLQALSTIHRMVSMLGLDRSTTGTARPPANLLP